MNRIKGIAAVADMLPTNPLAYEELTLDNLDRTANENKGANSQMEPLQRLPSPTERISFHDCQSTNDRDYSRRYSYRFWPLPQRPDSLRRSHRRVVQTRQGVDTPE